MNNPVPTDDVIAWVTWHGDHKDEARIHMTARVGNTEISTKFFGTKLMDRVCMWETMVFIDGIPDFSSRVMTWEEAQRVHTATIDRIKRQAIMNE